MNFLLDLNLTEKLNPGDALTYGLTNVLLGMGTVFGVLIILLVILSLFKVIFHDLPNRAPKKKESAAAAAPVDTPVVAQHNADEEIVAVIAAAIAMAEAESDGVKFRVVSFRKK